MRRSYRTVAMLCRRGRNASEISTMTGESSTPGLAIVPRLGDAGAGEWQFTGSWEIRHVGSGLVVPVTIAGHLGLGHARDALVLLGQLPIDWNQPVSAHAEVSVQINQVAAAVAAALDESRPALLGSSWERLPREWFLYNASLDDVDGSFESYAEAEQCLGYLMRIGESEGWVIRREEAEPWGLRCASTGCRSPLDVDGRVSHPAPEGLAEIAGGEGWRRLDEQHWICPRCSYQYTPPCPW